MATQRDVNEVKTFNLIIGNRRYFACCERISKVLVKRLYYCSINFSPKYRAEKER